jgi:hypothetical protein
MKAGLLIALSSAVALMAGGSAPPPEQAVQTPTVRARYARVNAQAPHPTAEPVTVPAGTQSNPSWRALRRHSRNPLVVNGRQAAPRGAEVCGGIVRESAPSGIASGGRAVLMISLESVAIGGARARALPSASQARYYGPKAGPHSCPNRSKFPALSARFTVATSPGRRPAAMPSWPTAEQSKDRVFSTALPAGEKSSSSPQFPFAT